MSKKRVYEVAKEINKSSKDVLTAIHKMGIEASNHMATLDETTIKKLKQQFEPKSKSSSDDGIKKRPVRKKRPRPVNQSEGTKADGPADKVATEGKRPTAEGQKKRRPRPLGEDGKPLKKKKRRPLSDKPLSEEEKLRRKKRRPVLDENGKPILRKKKKRRPKPEEAKQPSSEQSTQSKPIAHHAKQPSSEQSTQSKPITQHAKQPDKKNSQQQQSKQGGKQPDKKRNHTTNHKGDQRSNKHSSSKQSTSQNDANKNTDGNHNKGNRNTSNQHSSAQNSSSHNKRNKKKKQPNERDNQQKDNVKKTLSMQKKSRKRRHKKKEKIEEPMTVETIEITVTQLPARMTVGDFASAIDKSANEIILKLMNLGVMAAINQYVEYDTMELIAMDFGIEVEPKPVEVDQAILEYDFEDKSEDLVTRAPVVTVMGHVDHGKTSLLDAIRSTNVIAGEAGGITQHIGASEVMINDQKIVFLDTPGHEAFTSLRARGAQVTDIAILVVAADDGVMPQTIEAIDHARAADVPIIVAVNKIDKEGANPDRVKKELSEQGLLVEDWGGDVVCVHVSALKSENIDQLLEMVLLVAEVQELNANPNRGAVGVVIEANLDKGRGPVATVLIQNGHLKIGDPFVCGTTYGRVRAMQTSYGKRIKHVGPSSAVEITGMNEVAMAGDKFFVVFEDKVAKQIAADRALQIKEEELARASNHVTLEDIFNQIQEGKMKELNLIIKADAHGSLEALKGSLAKINNDNQEVNIKIKHANIGAITESDILLATASNTIVLGFNVRPSSSVIAIAKKENVEIKTYSIIYNLLNDIEAAMKGMLDPEFEEEQLGEVQVRATFKVPNVGTIAGGYVISGKVLRNSKIRLLRQGVIIHEGELSSLKRFKDDVKEVATGYECGLGIAGFNDLKEDDIIEAYHMIEKPRK